MRIAFFSDVHGHLRLLLHVVRNWQIAHESFINAILVAGDLGCFPDTSKFDRNTRRWIEKDPEEAGFARYFTAPHPAITQFHGESSDISTVRSPILFVPGNHEDYDYLQKAALNAPSPGAPENTFSVDCYVWTRRR